MPLALFGAGLLGDGQLVMVEPRRIAARAAARTLARNLGECPGATVGYQVRFERVAGRDTRILVVTEGMAAGRARARRPAGAVSPSRVPLYGALSPEEQDRAIERGRGRRVVLATNVAETSLTLEGASAVVDSGLMKAERHDPATDRDHLDTVRISLASAEQRAGRAGRLRPGRCVRLWTLGCARGWQPVRRRPRADISLETARTERSGAAGARHARPCLQGRRRDCRWPPGELNLGRLDKTRVKSYTYRRYRNEGAHLQKGGSRHGHSYDPCPRP